MTLVDHIALNAWLAPERLAAVDLDAGGQRWTYAALDRDVGACAAVLQAHGIAAGDRVAVLARNRVLLVVAHHACARLGAVYVPINWRLAEAEIAWLLADAEPALLIADDGCDRGLPALSIDTLAAAVAVEAPVATLPIDPAATSLILYTSGTSGRPKGAMLSEAALAETAINLSHFGAVGRDSRFLCDGPMFHIIGLVSTIRPALMWGGAILVADGFVAARTLARIADPVHGISHYFCVPQMAAMLRDVPGFHPAALRRLTCLFVGGAPLAPAEARRWVDDGVPLSNGFGMSECGTVCHTPLDPARMIAHAGSVGIPTPRVALRVVDDGGNTVPDGTDGELLVKGANVCAGYWKRPEANAAAVDADGWLHTGDIARIDADGFVWVIDRKKDMFISGGENVYPAEIEAALAGHPDIAECAVVGVPDARWGEVGHVALACCPARTANHSAIIAHLAPLIARYKIPKYVTIVAALPRTGSGKVQKAILREQLLKLSPHVTDGKEW